MKALVGAFKQEKALVGAFSVIVQPVVEPMDRFAALVINSGSILTSMSRLRDFSSYPDCITMSLQLLSVLMFAMISNQAWQPNMEGQEYCIINNSGTLSSQSCSKSLTFHSSRHCLPVPKCGGCHCLPGFHRSVQFIQSLLLTHCNISV